MVVLPHIFPASMIFISGEVLSLIWLVCLVIPNGTLFEAFALSFDLVCSLLLSKADILNEGP